MVKLRFRLLKNGETNILTDTHYKGKKRKTRATGIRLIPERTLADKSYNKKQLAIAELVRIKLTEELINSSFGFKPIINGETNFFLFAEQAISNRGETAVIKKLKAYVKQDILFMSEINEKLLSDFYCFLEKSLNYETPSCYMRKLKRIINEAYRQKLIADNPVLKHRKFKAQPKEILSVEELKKLIRKHCSNLEVKRAFLFCCRSGIRFCDAKQIRGNNIINNVLKFTQQKTGNEVQIILNKDALRFVANRINKDELLFNLKSHAATLKALEKWMVNAGILKKIGFHTSRRIWASQLNDSGVSILVTSQLMGHSNIRTTQRYIQPNNQLKEQAVNSLPLLF
ncbi:MAG TPA: site-specific integrase [Ferruginibacter sp.]|jgi:integrase/recombinase XerD|nr:site-specific integrase [Ferruginibacter sp.]